MIVFITSTVQGPYDSIPTTYTTLVAIWILCTSIYAVMTYVIHYHTSYLVCKLFVGFAVCKVSGYLLLKNVAVTCLILEALLTEILLIVQMSLLSHCLI